MMASKWRKAKLALGLSLCYHVPKTMVDDVDNHNLPSFSDTASDASLIPPSNLLSNTSTRKPSSENICSICLASMKPGEGHAIFTAECCHAFYFNRITSNVKHGNQICPVCRAKWNEIPLLSPDLDVSVPIKSRSSPRHIIPLLCGAEPAVFDDDEFLGRIQVSQDADGTELIGIKAYPEMSSVAWTAFCNEFTVLIKLKAAAINPTQNPSVNFISRMPRTPIDLVTVLDISGSMAGTKLALVKRAIGFVIHNMSSNDRLSVVTFSSTARRLFSLRRMSETGRQQALLAVNSLVANGGTNIAQGLRKGSKVMEERREKNPVANIILLSDGQETYSTINGYGVAQKQDDIPVHTFGFGSDHDSSLMHSISENSGGTFSFIQTEFAIQDAFAQCIGGLLSVIVQDLHVEIECIYPTIRLQTLKSGSYSSCLIKNGRLGFIDVGDLYADEVRDFLVQLNVPVDYCNSHTPLLKVKCSFKDVLTKELFTVEGENVLITRPTHCTVLEERSIEVDRERNRLQAAEAMSEARAAAEKGDLGGAVSVLENCRKKLSTTISAKSQDRLCVALDVEMNEMQERMASRHVYETSGRAYVLSGLSSHSCQRATTRGGSTDSSSLIQAYQTPSMVDMLNRSQATLLISNAKRLLQPQSYLNFAKPR